jgi:hypothetical protein
MQTAGKKELKKSSQEGPFLAVLLLETKQKSFRFGVLFGENPTTQVSVSENSTPASPIYFFKKRTVVELYYPISFPRRGVS